VSTPPFLDLPEGARATRVATDRGELAALTAPGRRDGPGCPVLLVPGFTGSKEDFIAVLGPIAAAGHPVTAVDLRGQYESPADDDPGSYEVSALAADVLAVARGLGTPVHLVGHSFGGLVARAAALAEPSAVCSLSLVGSGPAAVPDPSASNLTLLVQALPTVDLPTIWSVKRQMELETSPAPPAEIEEFLRRRFLANHPVHLLRLAEQLLSEPDRVAEVAALDLPLLVLYGEHDDTWPPAVQADMAARLGATAVVVPGCGHSPAADEPELTTKALVQHWAATG
jgi:pimeloyl-ACP methyl ester carboxylesterase